MGNFLQGKIAMVTDGDSGIGTPAVRIFFVSPTVLLTPCWPRRG